MDPMNDSFKTPSSLLRGTILVLCLLVVLWYLWKRKWLYYYSLVMEGPPSIPFVGSPSLVLAGQKGFMDKFLELNKKFPKVWRMWLGSDLYISTSRAKDVEHILINHLDKDNVQFYQYVDEMYTSIFTAKIDRWRVHRKNLNQTFNPKILNSYFETFCKHAKKLAMVLDGHVGKEFDVVASIWTKTLDVTFETLGRVDPDTLHYKNSEFLPLIESFEESVIERVANVLYSFSFIWKMSSTSKQINLQMDKAKRQIQEIVTNHQRLKSVSDSPDEKSFLGFIEKGQYTQSEFMEEIMVMFVAASETTAISISTALLCMGIYQDIQEKLYQEVITVCGTTDPITPDKLNSLPYLDRVIKEVLRMSPAIPMIVRNISKTFTMDSQVYPQGSKAIIPIFCIQRDPEYWSEPLKFNPDRFLPEEVKKRPRGSYIPFADGSRNCIGLKFGSMTVKIFLAELVRRFKVEPGKYREFSDVELVLLMMAKAKDGYKVKLTRREESTN